jgi:hypothetical protein
MLSRRRALAWLGASTLCVAGSGCALLTRGWDTMAGASRDASSELRLKPILKPRDAVELEMVFVERPVGDPLLGDELWREVGEISALGPDKREALRKHGLRVGVASSSLPRAVQTMMSSGESPAPNVTGTEAHRRSAHRHYLPSDGEQEFQVSPLFATCSVEVPKGQGTELRAFENCRFMFRMKAYRREDGWAKLEFTPEIHHGNFGWRPVPGDMGWEPRMAQEIVPLYGQRFELSLNVGELVVITAGECEPKSLGRHFFRSVDPDGSVQHVLLIRLTDISRVEAVRVE